MADFVADAQVSGYSLGGTKEGRRKGTKGLFRRVFISFVPFLLFSFSSFAQDGKAKQLYDHSIKLFSERKANEAIPFMEQAVKIDPNYADAHLRLGQLYEFTKRFEPALTAYRTVIQLQPEGTAAQSAYQSLSVRLMQLGRYAEALPYLEKYQTLFSPQSAQGRRIGRLLANARFAQEAVQHPQPVDPKPLSSVLQTTPSQYFPVLTADEQTLVFTVLKPEGDEDLMTATFNGETWSPPVSLSPNINTADNEGTASMSADGRTIVFTACQGRKGYGSCDLYLTRKTGDAWSAPENLGPVVNTRHYESQPSLSADGRRLYFVSDRPGGRGRRDVWRSDLDAGGNWGQPVNLGEPVNTPADEVSPFIHANGQSLFFGSDGHVGLGGYDLFVSDSSAGGWSAPANLGYPINNAEDQASLFVAANGKRAYYSYEEQKDGVSQKSRLYVFDLPESLRDRVKPVSYLKGVVADARTGKPLSATVDLIDLRTNQMIARVQADAQTGQYTTVLPSGGEYALYVSVPGYLFKSLSFDFTQRTKGDRDTGPRDAGAGATLNVPLEPAVASASAKETLNNLFFESNRYDLVDKSRTELDRLAAFLTASPSVKIEIAGHTDDRGDPAANLVLSKKRAQAVVDYLTKAGIAPERIRAVGYGKTRPAVPNTSDENRQRNRRIEWRVW